MAEKVFKGIGVSEGIRIGTAFLYKREQTADTGRKISENAVEAEAARFKSAVAAAAAEIDSLIEQSGQKLAPEKIGVIKGQKSILTDPAYCPEIEKQIKKNLLSAEASVKQVTEKFALIFENMKNDYMKERSSDIRDVGNRILDRLSGRKTAGLDGIDRPVILIADDLSPTDTIQLNKDFILAFATQKGGKTSHTSIFAKSIGIPAAVGLPGIMNGASDGAAVILDGTQGICIVSPEPDTLRIYEEKAAAEQADAALYAGFLNEPAAAGDGKRIMIAANIGSPEDAEYAVRQGAEGVGLLRTEQLYLAQNALPDEDRQFSEYKKIARFFPDREIIVRTLDIGGDKPLSYLSLPKEENPFLGYRAIRLCLDQKEIFLTQLKAILRAGMFGNLSIMFPMISGYDELMAAKSVLDEAKSQLKAENIPYNENIKVGMMVEIPSAALIADTLAREVDFFSIGTNDLIQYTLAADRGNEKVSYLYDCYNPAVLRLIKNTADAAHAAGIPVGMCGGMAGDFLAMPLLIGLELDELSMSANVIPKMKYLLSKVNCSDCEKIAEEALRQKSAGEIRKLLSEFSSKQNG